MITVKSIIMMIAAVSVSLGILCGCGSEESQTMINAAKKAAPTELDHGGCW